MVVHFGFTPFSGQGGRFSQRMQKNPLLYLLTVHIFLSFLLPVAEARITRSFALTKRPATLSIDEMNQVAKVDLYVVEEGFAEGRMDFEISDYPASGANKSHEPRVP